MSKERPEPFRVSEQHTSRCFFHEQAAELPRDTAIRGALPVVDRAAEPLLRIDDLAKTFRQDGFPAQPTSSSKARLSTSPATTAGSLHTTSAVAKIPGLTKALVVMSPKPRSSARKERRAVSISGLAESKSTRRRTAFSIKKWEKERCC